MNTILILTSNDTLMKSINTALQTAGFSLIQAISIQDAQEKITAQKPNMLIIDDETLAEQTTQFLSDWQTNINVGYLPILMLSETTDNAAVQNYINLGATDVLKRSDVNPENFVSKVQKTLSLGGGIGVAAEGVTTPAKTTAMGENMQNARVLIIEDDQFLNELSQTKLSKVGFQVISALDGESGLEKALQEKPDIILLDILLPGIDGFEVLRRIKSSQDAQVNKIPVILLSNFGQEEKIQQGMALGAKDYLVKANFTTNEIVTKIQKTLSEGQAG